MLVECILLGMVLMADNGTTIDYAASEHADAWLRHPVYGDPSFDAFERLPGNPINRGTPPFEWPVNGFLFEDPVSGDWFVYVGRYAAGYAMGEGKGMDCVAYRSGNQGRTWESIGPIFPSEPFAFDGETSPVGYAPDVSVIHADGRYHMVYDWATANSTWQDMAQPSAGSDNGIGYAWSDHPGGPFHRTPSPVFSNRAHPVYLGKYPRAYAATLIRRKADWLVLAMMDSGAHYSWALVGMVAECPEGPYSPPVFLRCVDDAYAHPPLLEFYPALSHAGKVYAPATSVARNRNFQAIFRAGVEDALDPGAWELFQHGSVWHAEDVENEHYGIWGQTFTGFVDAGGALRVMFPSRDRDGMGTINLATRPWEKPHRPGGFTLTGHGGSSLAVLHRAYGAFELDATLHVRGRASVLWAYDAVLGPDKPTADAVLHPLSLTRYCGVELSDTEWRVVQVDDAGAVRTLASGALDTTGPHRLRVVRHDDGQTTVAVDDGPPWTGHTPADNGPLGPLGPLSPLALLAGEWSHVEVERFSVSGVARRSSIAYLHTEAILGAGASNQAWRIVEDSQFLHGVGAVSARSAARAKWNVWGRACTLWAPRGPGYGTAGLVVDGTKVAHVDFSAPTAEPSAPRWTGELGGGFHAVVLEVNQGPVPLDVLAVESP